MAREQPKGTCTYCGTVVAKGGASRHLDACAARRAAIEAAEGSGRPAESLHHLRVEAQYNKSFWLDLEMRGSATLEALDRYLRAIWLECCGHLSQFTTGGWDGKVGMKRRADQVFRSGVTLTHIYDFGSSSYTLVRSVSTRVGAPTTRHPIALMARNQMPEAECLECQAPATRVCMQCVIEDAVWGALCDAHAKTHPHDDYEEPVPLVNSPRLGICGYTGPADPPY